MNIEAPIDNGTNTKKNIPQPWLLKVILQNTISLLPRNVGDNLYYQIQKKCGRLLRTNFQDFFRSTLDISRALEQTGRSVNDAAVLEVGTGRTLNLCIGLWLKGAKRLYTVDLNKYIKLELIKSELHSIESSISKEPSILERLDINLDRMSQLREFVKSDNWTVNDLNRLITTTYLAPYDASCLSLEKNSIDFHVSYNVMEHIPKSAISAILREAQRILKPDGLLVHMVDFSDHFSHSDSTLSPFEFLKYNQLTWKLLAGNRFMYANRLRLDDYKNIFIDNGFEVNAIWRDLDLEGFNEFVSRSMLNDEFKNRKTEDLATLSAMFVGKKLS